MLTRTPLPGPQKALGVVMRQRLCLPGHDREEREERRLLRRMDIREALRR